MSDDVKNIMNEAGALYYMQLDRGDSLRGPLPTSAPARDLTANPSTSGTQQQQNPKPSQMAASVAAATVPASAPAPTPATTAPPATVTVPIAESSRAVLGRKPTGARGPPGSNTANHANAERLEFSSTSTTTMVTTNGQDTSSKSAATGPSPADDLNAMAAITYMHKLDAPREDAEEEDEEPAATSAQVEASDSSPAVSPATQAPADGSDGGSAVQYKSTFAPSKQAEQRKLKSQAQQAAHDAAVHRPGRSNGKKKAKDAGAWAVSSDEEEDEEEEEEEEEEDFGSSNTAKPVTGGVSQSSTSAGVPSALPPPPPPPPTVVTANRVGHTIGHSPSPVASTPDGNAYSAPRPIRHLPQIPGKPICEFMLL